MKRKRKNRMKREIPLHLMILPAFVITAVFSYIPMFGFIIAFQEYEPIYGFFKSEFVGLENFRFILNMPNFWPIVRNTLVISFGKIIGNLVVPIIISLMLNEVRSRRYKRGIQTIIYLPHFVSWIILSGMFIDILSPSDGIVNRILMSFGMEPVFFLGDEKIFPLTMIFTDVWKCFGYGTIVYLAALTSIDLSLYEAAKVDGANHWQQLWHVTLPGLKPIIVLMTVLSLGNVLNAGFDQIYNLCSPLVYSTGDILDTVVYRLGIEQQLYSISTALSLVRAFVTLFFISLSYFLADRLAGYRVF